VAKNVPAIIVASVGAKGFLYVPPPQLIQKNRSMQIWSGFHEETGPCEKSAKQLQANILDWHLSHYLQQYYQAVFPEGCFKNQLRYVASKKRHRIVTEIDYGMQWNIYLNSGYESVTPFFHFDFCLIKAENLAFSFP